MYLKRKADAFLESWKADPDRLPLIIKGARQVGKTETIRHFAESRYKSVIYLNFVDMPGLKSITEEGYSANSIIKHISLLDPSLEFLPENTVIIFDEMQEFPDIATALKFFKTDGRFDVICSGSMLGVHYRKIHSNSVGYKTDYTMTSMDFEEFLWAAGYSGDVPEMLLDHMLRTEPLPDGIRVKLKNLFLDYCVLGGMPAVIRRYIESGTFSGSLSIQRQISLDYEEDVRKYADGLDQARILAVYRSIPAQLAKENKKFQFSAVKKGARSKDYEGCIEWLKDSGIVTSCCCLNFPELPLKGNEDQSRFKLYYADTGLLISLLDEEAQQDLRVNRNLGTYKGAIYENMTGEALTKQGYSLYYYKKDDSTLEEDFFIRTAKALIPVEVKATNGRSKSLSTLIRSEHYPDIRFGIKLADVNIGFENCIYTFPYFCAFLLKRYLQSMNFQGE
ncbi:MAG: AAA family ATPase [Clostridiales bacterium]|nr:AAA family ATPase [Clostridiales bacterium]